MHIDLGCFSFSLIGGVFFYVLGFGVFSFHFCCLLELSTRRVCVYRIVEFFLSINKFFFAHIAQEIIENMLEAWLSIKVEKNKEHCRWGHAVSLLLNEK